MFGYKPLMSPKPHRRDRRGAVRSERLQEVLLWPDRSGQTTRELASKRAAFARHQARYAPAERSWVFSALFITLVAVIGILAWREFVQSRHLVPLHEKREAYVRLVQLMGASCEGGVCSVGWYSTERPSKEMQRLMVDVRARRIRLDTTSGSTSIQGSHGADFALVYASPAVSPDQAQWRATQARIDSARRVEAEGWERYLPQVEVLGDGWTEIRRP